MDKTAIDRDALEEKLHDPTASPVPLPFDFLKDITCNFSEEQEIGRGGYGVVYKGVLRSGKIIAVKELFAMHLVDDAQFLKEATNVMGIKHQNIVQLVGYCVESSSEAMKLPSGTYVMAQMPRCLLCFEYLDNKSLDKHLSDESCGLDWNKRYEIIKGICSGLHFLHGECHIVHLDLKPANILMDAAMMPKIADFGLSRLLGEQKSRTIIGGNPAGSLGYMAPEYLFKGEVSPKADIFSFGVIVTEIMTGVKEYPMSTIIYSQEFNENGNCQSAEISLNKYRENVIGRWRDVFHKESNHTSQEIFTNQVEQCITTALECLNKYSTRRPTACDIYRMFTGKICSCQKKKLLSAKPFTLCFHFKKYHEVTSCPLELTNNTDEVVAFRIVTDDREKYFPWPIHGLVLPRSMYTHRVTLCRPLEDDNGFTIKLESTIIGEKNQVPVVQAFDSNEYNHHFTEAKNMGREVQQVNLLFVISHEPENVLGQIKSGQPASSIHRIFVHPTKTWLIMVVGMAKKVNILDYKRQEKVRSSDFLALNSFDEAIFIPRKQWFVVASFGGHIKVYNYETTQEVKTFRAHENGVTISSLDVHPYEPYVLSASCFDRTVKLWNWEKDWECISTIRMDQISEAKFNPDDSDYIVCTGRQSVKVFYISHAFFTFAIESSQAYHLEFLTRGDELYLIIGHGNGTVKIWDWRSRSCLKTLEGHTDVISTICAHPDLPLLITGSFDGTVCLWNTLTFELEGKLSNGFEAVYAIACLKGSTRIAIGHQNGLVIAEI